MSNKIASPADLQAFREKAKADIELRSGPKEIQITVHMGTCGIAAGARDVLAALVDELGKGKISNVTVRHSGCLGLCDREPMLTLRDKDGQEFQYGKLNEKKTRVLVQEHVLGGKPVADYLIK
jgi:NADP-reducing hydrogenase subunit HndB